MSTAFILKIVSCLSIGGGALAVVGYAVYEFGIKDSSAGDLYVIAESKTPTDNNIATSFNSEDKNYFCKLDNDQNLQDDSCEIKTLDLSSITHKHLFIRDLINKETKTTSSDLTSAPVASKFFKVRISKKIIDSINWSEIKNIDIFPKIKDGDKKYASLKPLFIVKNGIASAQTAYAIGKVSEFLDQNDQKQTDASVNVNSATFTCDLQDAKLTNKACTIHNFTNNDTIDNTSSFSWSATNATSISKNKYYIFKFLENTFINQENFIATSSINLTPNPSLTAASGNNDQIKKIKVSDLKPAVVIETAGKDFLFILK